MRYATPAAFRTALEQRLLAEAQWNGVQVSRLRKLVVFDRLLARLLVVAPNRWVLKGALALDFRLMEHARPTKDLDLAYHVDEAAATADFVAAQSVDLGDHFTFAIERTAKLEALLGGTAVRYHVVAELAGRVFDEVIIDAGFGNPLVSAPELLRGRDLLGFTEIDPVVVPALPLEQHVAEKVHAYTRTYVGGRQSTRVKDLIDLVLIRSHAALDSRRLRQAFRLVFDSRGSQILPSSLPPPPTGWSAAYRTMAATVGIDLSVSIGYRLAADLLNPILDGSVADDMRWDPGVSRWTSS
jgi:hypothetical protein